MDIPERKPSFEKWWPKLRRTGYKVTSPADPNYNCFAWVAHQTDKFWDPDPNLWGDPYYWPDGVERENTVEAFVKAYSLLGFEICNDAELEEGFEKIAIYATNGTPDHAARQLNNGRWTSKIGKYEDIEHSLDAFEGGQFFGAISVILKRVSNNATEER